MLLSPDTPAERLYFAFGDGRLHYDCHQCGAKCCRGFGYNIEERALLHQLQRRPAIRHFVKSGSGSSVINFPPACFFLSADNLCAIQTGSGFTAKPETCRIFPFNNIRKVGDYFVILPHEGLCPIEVVHGSAASEVSSHRELTANILTTGLRYVSLGHRAIVQPEGELICLERAIVHASEQHISNSFTEFVKVQVELTSNFCSSLQILPSAGDSLQVPIDDYLSRMCELLGETKETLTAADSQTDRAMVAFNAYLRANVLFVSTKGEHSRCGTASDIATVHLQLLATYLFVRLARQAGLSDVSFQSVRQIYSTCHEIVQLLSNLDRPIRWRHDASLALSFGQSERFQRSFVRIARKLTSNSERFKDSLWEIIKDELPLDPIERSKFIRLLAARLHGNIQLADDPSVPKPRRTQQLVFGFRRLLLGALPEDVLLAVASRE